MARLGSNVEACIPEDLSLLIYFLAFSEQNPHHVEIADFARSPYVIKRPLTFISLTEIEGKPILGASQISQSVFVCLPLE